MAKLWFRAEGVGPGLSVSGIQLVVRYSGLYALYALLDTSLDLSYISVKTVEPVQIQNNAILLTLQNAFIKFKLSGGAVVNRASLRMELDVCRGNEREPFYRVVETVTVQGIGVSDLECSGYPIKKELALSQYNRGILYELTGKRLRGLDQRAA